MGLPAESNSPGTFYLRTYAREPFAIPTSQKWCAFVANKFLVFNFRQNRTTCLCCSATALPFFDLAAFLDSGHVFVRNRRSSKSELFGRLSLKAWRFINSKQGFEVELQMQIARNIEERRMKALLRRKQEKSRERRGEVLSFWVVEKY